MLRTSDTMYIWVGKGANVEEVRCAESVAEVLRGN